MKLRTTLLLFLLTAGLITYVLLHERRQPPRDLAGFHLNAVEFEKDDDLHISLVTAVSNLRARNYRIKETTFFEAKMVAGKIVPAIATTTCAITGLVTTGEHVVDDAARDAAQTNGHAGQLRAGQQFAQFLERVGL